MPVGEFQIQLCFSLFVLVMFPNGVITVRLSPLIPKGAGAC